MKSPRQARYLIWNTFCCLPEKPLSPFLEFNFAWLFLYSFFLFSYVSMGKHGKRKISRLWSKQKQVGCPSIPQKGGMWKNLKRMENNVGSILWFSGQQRKRYGVKLFDDGIGSKLFQTFSTFFLFLFHFLFYSVLFSLTNPSGFPHSGVPPLC